MVGSFLGGRFLDRGHGHQMWAGCMATSVVMIVVISQLQHLGVMFIAFVLLGTVCGVGDVSGNTLVVWSRPNAPGAALNALRPVLRARRAVGADPHQPRHRLDRLPVAGRRSARGADLALRSRAVDESGAGQDAARPITPTRANRARPCAADSC